MKLRVLVTGASSHIGKTVGNRLKVAGHFPIGMIRDPQLTSSLPMFEELIVVDLNGHLNLQDTRGQVDSVIHIASAVAGTPGHLMRVNGLATAELAEWSIEKGCSNFIHLSSMAVYGDITESRVSSNTPITHHAPGDRFGTYGVAKWAAECYLNDLRKRLSCVSVRSCAIADLKTNRHFLGTTLAAMLAQKPVVQLSNPDHLFNNIIHIDTLAEFLVQLATDSIPEFASIPVASSHPIQLSEVISAMAKATFYRGRIDWSDSSRKPFHISTAHAEQLGFRPIPTHVTVDNWLRDIISLNIRERVGST